MPIEDEDSLSWRENRARELVNMWTFHNIAARTLIWLTAFVTPVQGLATTSCGCSGSRSCLQKTEPSPCCCCSAGKIREGRCCCAGNPPASVGTRCSGSRQGAASRRGFSQPDSACSCGATCRCGNAKQPTQSVPPVEDNTTEKLANDSVSATPFATATQPQVTRRPEDTSSALDALAAVDRCVSLCRFAL